MPQYCTITAREDVPEPQSGWLFMFDSIRYPLDGRPFTPEQAEHARAYFTTRPAVGEPDCLVDIEYHDGELELVAKTQPTYQRFDCPNTGCRRWFTDYADASLHIVECSQKTEAERAAKDEDAPAPDAPAFPKPPKF